MPDLTLAAALVAGLLSFLSPCVLPVVPAYLGQLGAVSVAVGAADLAAGPDGAVALDGPGGAALALRRRWAVMRHAVAFVLGFGGVFTLLGVTATYAGGFIAPQLPFLRQVGGVVLIVLGLNLAGLLPIGLLARTWRPLDRTGSVPRPLGARPTQTTAVGALGLGGIFALGWTPCIGPTLGAIFGLAASGPSAPAGLLFMAYSLGLGIPFLLLALALEEAPRLIRPLRRHARAIELAGGAMVALIGVALVFDWLYWVASRFSFIWPSV